MAGKSYTGKGDGGQTCLGDGTCRQKSDPVFFAVGAVDELSCIIGLAVAGLGKPDAQLEEIQKDLFEAGALVSGAWKEDKAARFGQKLARIERETDAMDEKLPELRHFILPGGCAFAARLHHARAACRTAERRVQALNNSGLAPLLKYLNRLSSYFFARARTENAKAGIKENEWKAEG